MPGKNYLSEALIIQRLELAMRKKQYSLASNLFQHFPEEKQHYLTLWEKLRRHPEQVLTAQALQGKDPFLKTIMVNGFIYLSQQDSEQAIEAWPTIARKLNDDQRAYGIREIGLNLARQHHKEALSWLSKVPEKWVDDNTRYWRIRAAIGLNEWEAVKKGVLDLPEEERNKVRWQYWLARALDHQQEKEEAQSIFNTLAQDRSFYGFLASEYLKVPYSLNHNPLTLSKAQYTAVFQKPGIQRALEWMALGRTFEAKREWLSCIKNMSEAEQVISAQIANQMGHHNLAILTMAKSSYKNDIEVRFPLAHSEDILKAANHRTIDPAWVFAIARQESAFADKAKSPVGALGLMQVMPKTAKQVAKQGKITYKSDKELLDAKVNVKIGSHYLGQLLKAHQGNMVLATAAYNAGPSRVKQWRPVDDTLSADQWIETIPFSETRDYVQNVVTYMGIYRQLLGKAPKIDDLMQPIVNQ